MIKAENCFIGAKKNGAGGLEVDVLGYITVYFTVDSLSDPSLHITKASTNKGNFLSKNVLSVEQFDKSQVSAGFSCFFIKTIEQRLVFSVV